MKKLIVAVALCIVLLCGCASYPDAPDAPGAWIPSPVGSGWCTAQGIPGIPDGFRAHCPRP